VVFEIAIIIVKYFLFENISKKKKIKPLHLRKGRGKRWEQIYSLQERRKISPSKSFSSRFSSRCQVVTDLEGTVHARKIKK
jgi:hypothetical protein